METMIKRVRQVNFNIFSRGAITVRARSFPFQSFTSGFADDRIDDATGDFATTILSLANETFTFAPSIDSADPVTGVTTTGNGGNILSIIPRAPQIAGSDWNEDFYGKPIRFSLEVESEYRTQINSFDIYWRPIHSYLA